MYASQWGVSSKGFERRKSNLPKNFLSDNDFHRLGEITALQESDRRRNSGPYADARARKSMTGTRVLASTSVATPG